MSGTVSEATTTLSSSLSTSNLSTILLLLGIVALGVYVFFELRKMNRRIDVIERSTPNTTTATTTTMDTYPQVIVDPMHNQSPQMGQQIPQQIPQPQHMDQQTGHKEHAQAAQAQAAQAQAQAQARGSRPSTPYPTSGIRPKRVSPDNAISEIGALMTEPQPSVMDTKPKSVDVFPIETEANGILNVPFPDISDLTPDGTSDLTRDISEDPFQSEVQGLKEQLENEDHSKKSVSELKEILLKWGLATSGNKKKLIQRINEHTGVKAEVVKTEVVKRDTPPGPTTTDVLSSLDVTVNPSEPIASDVAGVTEGSTGVNLSLP